MNGQDLDSDSIYTTNQKNIVELAKKAYIEFPTIINEIKYGTNEYDKSMKSYSRMDHNISASQYNIGSASNIAQLALSYWFDSECKNKELEDVFIICSVLAQVAIDSSKRNFEIKVGAELTRIGKMDCMKYNPKYPVFYAEVQKYNNKKKKGSKLKMKESDIGFFNCPMDLLYRIIEDKVIDLRKYKDLNTKTYKEGEYGVRPIFEYKADKNNVNRKQCKKIISIIEEYERKIDNLEGTKDSYYEDRLCEFETCMDKLKNINIKKDAMYTLIAYAFKPKNEYLRDSMLVILYDKDKELFLECFKKNEKSSQKMSGSTDFKAFSKITYEEGCEQNVS